MIKVYKPRGFKQWFEIYKLYQRAFPNGERKPFSIIWEMYRKGKTDVWYCEKDGAFAGLATTINSEKMILLDYFAVSKKLRGGGVGTAFLAEMLKQYDGCGVFGEIEYAVLDYLAVGVYIRDPLLHHLGLVFTDGRMKRYDLTVDVRDRNHVLVDEVERSHSASRECFRNVSAHSAYAEYGNACILKLFESRIPDDTSGTVKNICHK